MLAICRQLEEEYSRKKSEFELERKQLEEEHRKSLESCQRCAFCELQSNCLDLLGNRITTLLQAVCSKGGGAGDKHGGGEAGGGGGEDEGGQDERGPGEGEIEEGDGGKLS